MDPRRKLHWTIALAGIFLLALLLASQLFVWVNLWPITITWADALVWSLPQLLIWALVVPLILALGRRFPIEGTRSTIHLFLHLAASLVTALLVLAVLDLSDHLLSWSTLVGAPSKLVSSIRVTVVHLHIGVGIYWVVLAVLHALRYYDQSNKRQLQASRLETQLARAQLDALRMQLNPHFLFNTLNSIAVLIRQDVGAAERMLHRLSDLLHVTLDLGTARMVTLQEELDHVASYLDIEKIRFRDRLAVKYEVERSARRCRVPFLLLQPLVENAVRYAVALRADPATIEIGARIDHEDLELAVRDDGPGLDGGATSRTGHGVGLDNVRRRLRAVYGDAARLEVHDRAEGGLEALIIVPAGYAVDTKDDRPADGGSDLRAEGEPTRRQAG